MTTTRPVYSLGKMLRCIQCTIWVALFLCFEICNGQLFKTQKNGYESIPLPFPSCKADDIECLRRGFRTFFFLMDAGHLGMQPVDPTIVNSVAVSLPEQQVSFLMRRINVTGAKWTKLLERRFHLSGGSSGVIFNNDLHVRAEILMTPADRTEPPYTSFITMDIQDVETNITYPWSGVNINNDDYINLGPERIEVRNRRTPSYFLYPNTPASNIIDATLQMKPSVLDYFSNEIVAALMHSVVENFRLFARKVPVKYYYLYNSFQMKSDTEL